MELIIDLRDHNKSHCTADCTLDDDATVKQLKEKVASLLQVNYNYQELFFGDTRLYHGTLKKFKVKDGDTIVVKHRELHWWSQYCLCIESVLQPSNDRVGFAKRAVEHHERLVKSGFFNAYFEFENYRLKYHYDVAAWADGDIDLMAKAAEKHFYLQHGQRGGTSQVGFNFNYEPRTKDMKGTRRGIIVDVQLYGENQPSKYSIKCHHYGSHAFSSKGSPPDIIELFCYKLLEVIKVGPAVQFIFPSKHTGTKTATCIATKWRDDFIRLFDIANEDDFNIEALVQLRLLNVLLFIEDLHGDNCGQWSDTKKAAVVDLMPGACRIYPNVKKAMFGPNKLNWNDVPRGLLANCSQERFWSIVEKCLHEWNLLKEIERASESIAKEKDQMKALAIGFRGIGNESEYTVTDELDHYLETIKTNVTNLLNELKPNE